MSLRSDTEKTVEKINRELMKRLRSTRLQIDLARRKLERLRRDRRELIELADKTMTHESIGSALGLTKQRVSKILAARQKEGRNG